MFIITNAIFATTISPDVWYKYKLSTAGFYPVLVAKDSWFKWIVIISMGITIIKEANYFGELIKYACITINRAESLHTFFYKKLKWTIILWSTKYHK